jgi:hypothetical protein
LPKGEDLAPASFAAAICLVFTSADQTNRSARNTLSEILRRWLRMTVTDLRLSKTGSATSVALPV